MPVQGALSSYLHVVARFVGSCSSPSPPWAWSCWGSLEHLQTADQIATAQSWRGALSGRYPGVRPLEAGGEKTKEKRMDGWRRDSAEGEVTADREKGKFVSGCRNRKATHEDAF